MGLITNGFDDRYYKGLYFGVNCIYIGAQVYGNMPNNW